MATEEKTQPSIEGPGKGKLFFDRARTVAESGNYDYAIDMFIEGLNREPQEVSQHEALFRVSLERKIKGGKPAGGLFGPKTPLKGKTSKDNMLNATWLIAKDPGNLSHMRAIAKAARDGGYVDVLKFWLPKVIIANKAKPNKDIYLEVSDMYRGIGDFHSAADAIQLAMELAPLDMALQQLLKDVSAEAAIKKGNYEKGGDFKESLNDQQKTKDLLQEDALAKTREYRAREVEKARLEYEAAPLDHRMISKYALALRNMEEESFENMAADVLKKAYEATKTYQYKRSIDEIKIRQIRRRITLLRDEVKFSPDDVAAKEKLRGAQLELLDFELAALQDWADHYPTDMALLYELGVRQFLKERYDEAMGSFQQAQANPRHRVDSLYYLGHSFHKQRMLHEAEETFRTAVSEYDLAESGNDTSKKLYYSLARVYEEVGKFPEAAEIYSKLTRWDINYKDARARLAEARKKVSGK